MHDFGDKRLSSMKTIKERCIVFYGTFLFLFFKIMYDA